MSHFLVADAMPADIDPGRLWIDEEKILHYRSATYGGWSVPCADIRVIGEYTTHDGPLLDDWFLVFVRTSGVWYEASYSASDSTACLHSLEMRFGASMKPTLVGSTDFASRILWPTEVTGMALFDFSPVPERGVFGWLRRFLGMDRIERRLSEVAVNVVRQSNDDSS